MSLQNSLDTIRLGLLFDIVLRTEKNTYKSQEFPRHSKTKQKSNEVLYTILFC